MVITLEIYLLRYIPSRVEVKLQMYEISQLCFALKGMVHLIFKLHLKVVFLSMKYDDAISFGHNMYFLTQSAFQIPKNKRETPKIMPDYPKNIAWQ